MSHDMESKFPPHDSCQSRLQWAHKEDDLTQHPVADLVLHVGDAEKFPQTVGLESLDRFLRVRKQGPCLTAKEEGGDDKRL